MLKKIARLIKNAIYKLKFSGKKVAIDWSCNLAAKGVYCEGMNTFHENVSYRGSIGYGSFIGKDSDLNANIGRYCSIGVNVKTSTGTHPTKVFVSTHPAFYSTRKQAGFSYVTEDIFSEGIYVDDQKHVATIGNDVWIANNALLVPGVHIHDGAIVAAGAVVTKDVEPYTIVGGVPAKEIGKRFDDRIIEQLLRIQWWNWPEEVIQKKAYCFNDIKRFLEDNNKVSSR